MTLQLAALMFIAGLSGCGSQPMRLALTELGTTSDSEYGAYGMRFIRAVNITGLGPEEVVGTMTTDPDKWSLSEQLAKFSPKRPDLPDSMSPRLRTDQSQVIERTFCKHAARQCTAGGVTLSDLTSLRDTLQKQQADIASAAHDALKQEAIAAAQSALATNDTAAASTLAQLQALFPEDAQTSLKDLPSARLQAAVPTARVTQALDVALRAPKNALNKSGVLVTHWEREVSYSASASAGEDAKGSLSGKKKIGGFLILGEPRITSLQFGDDLVKRLEEQPGTGGKWAERLFEMHRNYITHYQLRARYVVFAESSLSALQGSIKADLAAIAQSLGPQVAATLSARVQALSVKIDAAYAAISASSETGVMDAGESFVTHRPFSFERLKMPAALMAEMSAAEGTLPVISIRISLDDYIEKSRSTLASRAP